MDFDILTTSLKVFEGAITGALGRLVPQALSLFQVLVVLQCMLLGLWMLMGQMADVGPTLITLTLKLATYLWLITGWGHLTKALVKGFVIYGLHGGGGDISMTDFTDPSKLAWFGFTTMARVVNRLFAYTGWVEVLSNLPDILATGVVAGLGIWAFSKIAIEVWRTLLEFYTLAAVVIVLVPFGMIPYTTFLAEKAIAMIFAVAVKLLIMSFITGITLTILKSPLFEIGLNPTLWAVVAYTVLAWAVFDLMKSAPRLAQGLLQGSPQLTAQDVTRAVTQAVQVTMATIMAVGGGAQSLALAARAAQQAENEASERRRA